MTCLGSWTGFSSTSAEDNTTTAQTGAQTKAYSALCVVARDENRYIREWALYHLCLGGGCDY